LGRPTWIEGNSLNVAKLSRDKQFDFIFSCPPYFDLEVYSDSPGDLSASGSYELFLRDYRKIIGASCAQLRDNRFAAFVVGDIRDKKGYYRNFVSDTIAAFRDAGLELYNEGILITSVGSLALRVAKQFVASRKFGKAHQNVLVFIKGDPRKATEAVGEVEFGEIETAGFEETTGVETATA
jgi:DNA modification methylase